MTAVEFIQAFSDQNESSHRHLGNTSFVCADVTKLEQPEGSVDVIFINWLLMYLGDDEVACARAGLLFSRHLLLLARALKRPRNRRFQSRPSRFSETLGENGRVRIAPSLTLSHPKPSLASNSVSARPGSYVYSDTTTA